MFFWIYVNKQTFELAKYCLNQIQCNFVNFIRTYTDYSIFSGHIKLNTTIEAFDTHVSHHKFAPIFYLAHVHLLSVTFMDEINIVYL